MIHALNDYQGAVLLITHDVYLAEATAERLWLVNEGRAAPYDGDLSDYRKLVLAADKSREGSGAPVAAPPPPPTPPRRSDSEIRRATADIRKRISAAEREMERLQAVLSDVDAKLADPNLYARDPGEAQSLGERRDKARSELETAEQVWLEANEAYEAEASA